MDAPVNNAVMHCDYQAQPEPQASHGHSMIDVSFCGICGSDMHAWHGHDSRCVPPLILGHEVVGRAVDGPYAGQLVAINPLLNCGTCATCRSGATHLCGQREMIGMRLPEDADPDALATITRTWLDRPETNLEFAANLLILAAVDDAYGCDRAK